MFGQTWQSYLRQTTVAYRRHLLGHPNTTPLYGPHATTWTSVRAGWTEVAGRPCQDLTLHRRRREHG